MELDLGPEIAEFRAELRDWIGQQAPEPLSGLADWNQAGTTGGYRNERMARALAHPAYKEWEQRLLANGLVCPQWPADFGGKSMDAVRVAVLNEEFYRAGVPRVVRGMGEALVGPSIIVHGSAEQQAYFLPRIISGEDRYCQGFSEPGHGSDLAAVETKGEVDGDEIKISGQKVWTSGAAYANMMFALCRTDPTVPKHAGLSYVLFDFTDPAVTYSPIRQMSGAAEFAEDFIDGVRAPLFNIIGGLNNGWRVAMTTLGHERGGRATVQHLGFAGPPAAGQGVHRGPADAVLRHADAGPGGLGPPAGARGVGGQAVLERVPQEAGRGRGGDRGQRRPAPAGRPGLPDEPVAERLPVQPGRDHLLRHQRDPAQHHQRARAQPAQGAAAARLGGRPGRRARSWPACSQPACSQQASVRGDTKECPDHAATAGSRRRARGSR
jgi:hypothetical protein